MAQTVNMKPASGQLYNHPYNPITVASLDFGEFLVHRFIECEKSDKWETVEGNGFLRLAALDFPAYGRCWLKTAAFFVPYYQLVESVDAHRNGLIADRGVPVVVPHFTTETIIDMFVANYSQTQGLSTLVKQTATPSQAPADNEYDFFFISVQQNVKYYNFMKLKPLGRKYYKLLKSLGYDFRSYTTGSYDDDMANTRPTNAYTLLAFAKTFCDYFLNIHLYNTYPLVALIRAIHDTHDFEYNGNVLYNRVTGVMTHQCLRFILDSIYVPYESSMYLDAWNTLNSPIGSKASEAEVSSSDTISPVMPTITESLYPPHTNIIRDLVDSVQLSHTSFYGFSQLGLNSLGAIYDFVLRNNLSGSEASKRAFARFGIKGNDFKSYFVRKLYEGSQDIDFSAVMSNSNTVVPDSEQGSFLGAYAGCGLGSLNFQYNYECADYGVILNISWLQIAPLQLHGFDPAVLRMHQFDWYSPEYDGKAYRAIPIMEISGSKLPTAPNLGNSDVNIFGYTNIYEEYRHMRDMVLGDFVLGHAKNFVFARDISVLRRDGRFQLKPQTIGMQTFNHGDNPELTDPFMYSSDNGDRFYLQVKYNIKSQRPVKSESAAIDLNGTGDLELNISGNQNT